MSGPSKEAVEALAQRRYESNWAAMEYEGEPCWEGESFAHQDMWRQTARTDLGVALPIELERARQRLLRDVVLEPLARLIYEPGKGVGMAGSIVLRWDEEEGEWERGAKTKARQEARELMQGMIDSAMRVVER